MRIFIIRRVNDIKNLIAVSYKPTDMVVFLADNGELKNLYINYKKRVRFLHILVDQ